MFAIVKICGKQYMVEKGKVSVFDYLNYSVGDDFVCDDVLFYDGCDPLKVSAKIKGRVVSHEKLDKVLAFKKRRRTAGLEKVRGHRQIVTSVLIDDILIG